MRDALGGTVVLVIIVVFIVFALAYMAFNVNYTKAFRMKNKIISVYEDFEGDCSSSDCQDTITEYARTIGYSYDGSIRCPEGFDRVRGLYCLKENMVDAGKSNSSISIINGSSNSSIILSDINGKHYFTVITKINLHIPVINRILDLSALYVRGDTKTFEIKE